MFFSPRCWKRSGLFNKVFMPIKRMNIIYSPCLIHLLIKYDALDFCDLKVVFHIKIKLEIFYLNR